MDCNARFLSVIVDLKDRLRAKTSKWIHSVWAGSQKTCLISYEQRFDPFFVSQGWIPQAVLEQKGFIEKLLQK